MVVPSETSRHSILVELTALGYHARGTGSLEEGLALVEAGAVDTLVLDVSAFSTTVLTQLGRAMNGRRSIVLIASVSVVSSVGAEDTQLIERQTRRPAVGGRSPWQVATYWLALSRPSQFSAGLRGPNLN